MRLSCLFCLCVMLFVPGCQEAPDQALLEMQNMPAASIARAIQDLTAHPVQPTRCDQQALALQQAIVEGLHQNGEGIAEVQQKLSQKLKSATYGGRQVGPIVIVTPPAAPTPADDATSFEYGWPLLQATVAAASEPWDWFFIFRASQGILMDDINRRLYGRSMSLDAKTLADAQQLQQALYTCLGDPRCTALAQGEHIEKLNPAYTKLHEQAERAQTKQMKRALLRQLAKQVARDVDAQHFAINESITVEGHTLWVPIDPGNFAGHEATLAEFIEPIWKTGATRVRIRWTNRATHPEAYRFEAHPYVGRAYVERHGRTINIFNGDTPKVIAHEFGHVLGLPDHYYTTWSDVTCTYTSTADSKDIMSDSQSGHVTPNLWRELAEVYGLPVTWN